MSVENKKIDEILEIVRDERQLNNSRYSQISATLVELRQEIRAVKTDLKSEIDKAYSSLSEDIQAVVSDQSQMKSRLTKLEKKIA